MSKDWLDGFDQGVYIAQIEAAEEIHKLEDEVEELRHAVAVLTQELEGHNE